MIASFYVDAKGAIIKLKASQAGLVLVLDEYVETQSNYLLGEIKENAPKRSGEFAKGIRRYRVPAVLKGTKAEIQIVAGGKHGYLGPFLMRGTKPHLIRSEVPMPLGCSEGEVFAFSYTVSHPGTKASPFVTDALKSTNRRLAEEGKKRVRMLPMMR